MYIYIYIPWEPTTFIFSGYDPYIEGLKPSLLMVLGSKGIYYIVYIYILFFVCFSGGATKMLMNPELKVFCVTKRRDSKYVEFGIIPQVH